MPIFKILATVIIVENLDQVDRVYHENKEHEKQIVFISASPPHQTPINLECPTICLFAWEFPNIPNRIWDDEPRNDWTYVLQRIAGAITCSQESAEAVRNQLGPNYPIAAIPAPIWQNFSSIDCKNNINKFDDNRFFEFTGQIIDSKNIGFSANGLVQHITDRTPQKTIYKAENKKESKWLISSQIYKEWIVTLKGSKKTIPHYKQQEVEPEPNKIGTESQQRNEIHLSGVVYTAILNPMDGRKNWDDIVTAFCWNFRNNPKANLILKMTHHDFESYRIFLLTLLSRLSPFECRVLVLHGFIEQEKYNQLIQLSDFYVNASNSEGLCIPLMEFLACGKPAIAPAHTAMKDYIDPEIAFIVDSSIEITCWPHDKFAMNSTRRHRIHWASLRDAYKNSYDLFTNNQERYSGMSWSARDKIKNFSASDKIEFDLGNLINKALKISNFEENSLS